MRTTKKVLKFKKFKIANLSMRLIQGGGETNPSDSKSYDIEDTCKTTSVPASDSDNPCSEFCIHSVLSE